MMKNIKISISVLICLALTGCMRTGLNEQYMSNSESNEFSLEDPSKRYVANSLYCYETIGNPDCYTEPQAERERQLINHYPGRPKQNDIIVESLN